MRNILIGALLVTTACTSSGIGGDVGSDGTPLGTPENPAPMKTGPYKMVNTVDFTTEAILPAQGELIVATLRAFSTNPARGLIDAADAAGVPAIKTLYDLLPGVITDRLEGWVNDEIAKVKVNGHPITDYTSEVVGYFDIALTQFAVDSELTIDGSGTATHRITGLDLHPAGIDFRLPIGGLAGDVLTQNPPMTIDAGGALGFGEQHFGLNYGDYAWQGIEALSTAAFGKGVRAVLGDAVNCPNLAHNIANKCVLGVCVGHESTLKDVCEGGLDAVVNGGRDLLAKINIDALHFATGTAILVDDDGDGVGDRITQGTWDAEMNLGLGMRHTPAAFEGTR